MEEEKIEQIKKIFTDNFGQKLTVIMEPAYGGVKRGYFRQSRHYLWFARFAQRNSRKGKLQGYDAILEIKKGREKLFSL